MVNPVAGRDNNTVKNTSKCNKLERHMLTMPLKNKNGHCWLIRTHTTRFRRTLSRNNKKTPRMPFGLSPLHRVSLGMLLNGANTKEDAWFFRLNSEATT
jgi:hypothetical protein